MDVNRRAVLAAGLHETYFAELGVRHTGSHLGFVMPHPNLYTDALRIACTELARSMRTGQSTIDNVISDAMVDRYMKAAQEYEDFVVGQERDPNLLVHIVRYMAAVHAIPPVEGSLNWFHNVFHVLLELACPNAGVDAMQEPFFREVQLGIQASRDDYAP